MSIRRARSFIYNIMLLKICLKVLVTIQLTMYMRFLYVTEFLAESNEETFFVEADTVGPGLLKGRD